MQASFSNLIHQGTGDGAPARPAAAARPTQVSNKMNVILYVWGNRERSSANALDIANESGAIDYLSIVDVRDLRISEIPEWLQGVPTVLTVEDETMYKGTAALQFMGQMMQARHLYTSTKIEEPPPQQQQDPRMADPRMADPRMADPRMADPRMADPRMMQQRQMPPQQMPVQQMAGIGAIPQRQTNMMRGIQEQMSQQPQQQQPPISMSDDTKVSANDMQVEIEQILKRREQLMNEAGNQNGPPPAPLPTVNSRE
jgi:hypothetical protein